MKFTDILENYIILKDKDRDLYYDVKDNIDYYREFIEDILLYNIFIKDDFIKLEKIPVKPKSWMGIKEFTDKKEYVFFILILMYLEDKNKEEQFILSNITEYIEHNYPNEKIEWTIFKNRKSLINVLKVCLKIGIIKKNDGEEETFIKDETGEVLYESTGISKYVIRRFSKNIDEEDTCEDLLNEAWEGINTDKGIVRKSRAFRSLLLNPIVYNEAENDSIYDYIKKFRSYIKNVFEKYLEWEIHIHRNGAMAIVKNLNSVTDTFPNMKGESTIVLFINKKIVNMISLKELIPNEKDIILLNKNDFEKILLDVRNEDGHGFTKSFRECSEEYYLSAVEEFMKSYDMIRITDENVKIMPLTGKVIGKYPDDYKEAK